MSGHVLPLLRIPSAVVSTPSVTIWRGNTQSSTVRDHRALRILGIGYASKGWQKGSVLVPVRTDTGQAMGYWAIPEGTTVREIALAGRVSWCEW
jgi:hypothetical protein